MSAIRPAVPIARRLSNWFSVLGIACLLPALHANATTITAPATSASGAFTVSWPAGYELRMADSHWRVAAAPATSASFTELPAGTYRFVLAVCFGSSTGELGHLYACSTLPSSAKSVVVTGTEPPAVEDTTTAAGNTPYRASVSLRGSAQIAVPLRTPAGVNGVALDLALAYDSARHGDRPRYLVDDVLGYGWSLQGVSQVHRCRVGQSGDSHASGMPGLAASDAICLDGEPLVLVGGVHWGVNAEYRAAANPDLRITLRDAGSGARWFEVRYPDGAIGRFGDTSDSRVVASGQVNHVTSEVTASETFLWGLRKLTGSLGNELTVAYERFDGYGILQPRTITYAGAEVRFTYGPRADLPALGMGATAQVRRISVLNGVQVRMRDKPVREYRLGNRTDEGGRLRLERIQECGYDGQGGGATCLAPLQIAWAATPGGAVNHAIAVTGLTDGLGAQTGYTYARVTADSNPLGYPEAPFGAFAAAPDTAPTETAAVAELRIADGLAQGSFRRWSYRYRGAPQRSSRNRGYIGFAELRATDMQSGAATYTQARLDWPFLGMVSQVRSFDAPFGSHTQELAREEHAYAEKIHANGARHVYRARTARWLLEGEAVVGGTLSSVAYCYRALQGDACPATGTESDFATQRRTVTTDGVAMSNPGFAPAFWGDVPVRTIPSQSQRRTVTELAELANSPLPWVRGAVTRQATTYAVSGQPSRTVRQETAYVAGTRVVRSATRFPGDAQLELASIRTFDAAAGNAVSARTLRGANVSEREWRFATPYEDDRHAMQVTNPLGQTSSRAMDDRFGLVRSVTDPDGRTATIEYDPFGRQVRAVAADGDEVAVVYERCDQADCRAVAGAEPGMKMTVTTRNGSLQTAPTRVTYLDVLGRTVLEEVQALDAAQGWRSRRTGYDDGNRVRYRSRPSLGGAAPSCTGPGPDCTWYSYDVRGRVVREERPDGGVTATTYSGAAGRITVAATETVKIPGLASGTRTTRLFYDVLGLVTQTTDAAGSTAAVSTMYTYDALGNLTTVAVGGTTVATIEYDLAGNRTKMVDASSGTTEFTFNAFGELVGSTDAKGQPTAYEYDPLGRLVRRIDAGGIAHTWTWDAENATGRLASRARPGFTESYTYASGNGRLTQVESQVNVSGIWTGSHTRSLDYDSAGRLASQQYPNGQTVTYGYSDSGYPTTVASGGIVLRELHATDAFGNPREERFHDAAFQTRRTFDPGLGRLTRIETGTPAAPRSIQDFETVWRSSGALHRRVDRRDTATAADDFTDAFAYDGAGRLTRQTTTAGVSRVLDFGYATNGNLTGKSSSIAGDLDIDAFQYGSADQPYRLTGVTIGGIANTLNHDLNGNVIGYAAAAGPQTWLRYDTRNNLVRITVGPSENEYAARDQFWYDPDDRRFLSRESWQDGDAVLYRRVLRTGGDYEEIRAPLGAAWDVVQRIQLTPAVRQVRRRDASTRAWDVVHEYTHRDHLGSIDVITDADGGILSRASFDPFGTRRAAGRTSDLTADGVEALLDEQDVRGARGFTDHEHRDRTGFIHMNGRVYDPRIGQFVSPDPVVQAPRNSQSYNRYAYVFNDPVSRTDPSGLCGREEGYQLNMCSEFGEQIDVWGEGPGGGGGYFGGLNIDGGSILTLGVGESVGRLTLPQLGALLADLRARLDEQPDGNEADTGRGEVIDVTVQRDAAGRPREGDAGWLVRGLAGLDSMGVRSLFGSICLGAVLGGCAVIAVETSTGAVYAMLLAGVVPGAGLSVGTEGVLFESDFQSNAGFGTAVMVSGGVGGVGGSVAMAQGTNGANVTTTVGYGFGLSGGVGFYYAMPIGSFGN